SSSLVLLNCLILYPYTTLFRSSNSIRTRITMGVAYPVVRVRVSGPKGMHHDVQDLLILPTFAGHPAMHVCFVHHLADLEHIDERSEEHTSELQSREKLVCRRLL